MAAAVSPPLSRCRHVHLRLPPGVLRRDCQPGASGGPRPGGGGVSPQASRRRAELSPLGPLSAGLRPFPPPQGAGTVPGRPRLSLWRLRCSGPVGGVGSGGARGPGGRRRGAPLPGGRNASGRAEGGGPASQPGV